MKRILYRLLLFVSFSTLLGGLFVFSVMVYFSFSLPKITTLADYKPPLRSKILSKDGVVLAEIGKENREIAKFNEIPKLVVDAFLSAEDDGFYEHTGVDYLGVLRALVANIKAGRVVQGGSTITQQVAKSLLLTRERSITRKIKDFLLAQKIEKRFSKEDILFLYLNQVYLGGGYYGVKSAFRGYFDKSLEEATPAEAALIAGLLVAPGKYSPYRNPKYAKVRQKYVLGRMYANKKISKEQYEASLEEKIKYRLKKNNEFKAGYFTEHVRQQVISKVGEKNFLNNGFTVQTTLDYELQNTAETEITSGAEAIDKRQGYKGPIKTISPDMFAEFDEEARRTIYKKFSNYFTIGEKFERVYEVEYDENELKNLEEKRLEEKAKLFSSKYKIGNSEEDKMIPLLSKDKKYQAIVTGFDNRLRLIYVSLGGAVGVIPYKYFRWAHERTLSDKRQYFPYVTTPSEILQVGDVILVKIKDASSKIEKLAFKSRLDRFKKSKDYDLISKQSYIEMSLEQEVEVQASLLSINPFSGEVISMVGGVDFDKSKFNRPLQSIRQPGSSFKPLLFAAGLENGYQPNTIIHDTPEALGGADSSLNWKPRNYDGKFKGPMTFRESLQLSRNIPTIKIAMNLGMPKINSFLERTGFNAKMPNDLSISLGSFGVTLLELVKAYSIYPNGGKKIDPKFIISIVDRDGKEYLQAEEESVAINEEQKTETIEVANKDIEASKEIDDTLESKDESDDKDKVNPFHLSLNNEQVYDPRLAYIMTNLLKGVVHYGTGRSAKSVSPYLGGKTGTTSSYVDAWFLGFSQNIVTGVWTGFDDNKTMGWGETGTKSALPIWKGYMAKSILKYGEKDFEVPLGIVNVYVDKKTGKVTDGNSQALLESFVEGREPGNKALKSFFEDKSKEQEKDIFEDDEFLNDQ